MSNFTNSALAVHTRISPNRNTPRNAKIDTITIHHCAGNISIEALGELMLPAARQMSSNYGIGSDGRIGLYCPESDRAWTSSSAANDNRAITIEVANNSREPDWTVSGAALASLIELCADICRRNGIPRLLWRNDKSLIGQVDKQNMTVHSWFKATNCPGPYLLGKMGYIADEVNKRLGAVNPPVQTNPPAVSTPPLPPLSEGGGHGAAVNPRQMFYVQVGAFSVRDNAERFLNEVKKTYPGSFIKQF